MNIGLFIPCYMEQFYPQVGIATVQLLEKLGCEITYPLDQTYCGQPMAGNMTEAYQKIEIDQDGFGVFIAGPSKTADIEQSLVIGAQGARSFTVIITQS